MEILLFIFELGIIYSIFAVVWGIFRLGINMLREPGKKNQTVDYVLRITKYFFLVSVTAYYVAFPEKFINPEEEQVLEFTYENTPMILSVIVLGLYLLGKLQNRAFLKQLEAMPMLKRFSGGVDLKVEKFLLLGSMVYFIACLYYPPMVDNNLMEWFANVEQGLSNAVLIGWIFNAIAFFFLIAILMRAVNVTNRLLKGQSIMNGPSPTGDFKFKYNKKDVFDEHFKSETDEDGFSDYEDVTGEDDSEEK